MVISDLTKKAVAAYESSELKEQDIEILKRNIADIQQFLAQFGVDVLVDRNPFEIDGIRLFVNPAYKDQPHGAYSDYVLDASRKCPRCKSDLTFEVNTYCTPAQFGRWLSEDHPCEFQATKPVRGFSAS